MARLFGAVRTEERRDVSVAFLTLFALVGSHAVLETARDALFLSRIPSSRLPIVYIAIAAASLAAAEVHARLSRTLRARTALQAWIAIAAAGTLAFWVLLPRLGESGLYALYVWSGVIVTLALLQFWTLVGGAFSITQAKRLFAPIGLGSVLGATAGSAAASALAGRIEANQLVLVAAVGFAIAATIPGWLREPGAPPAGEADLGARRDTLVDAARYVWRQPFARRLVALAMVVAAAGATADFLFKSSVAAAVEPGELTRFLALAYTAFNAASLVVQLVVVRVVLRRLNAVGSMAVLPLLLIASGAGVAVAGGLIAALVVKATDGALRHTLYRTASELLFVPLPGRARARVKAFADTAGQRGGQCIASLALLVGMWLGAGPTVLAVGLGALAVVWLALLADVQRRYLALFRGKVGSSDPLRAFPDLDVASLEVMVGALDSDDERKVIAAMEALERERKVHLVPTLIVYHPSEAVVDHALSLFVRTSRRSALHAIDRLADHPSVRVRQAMVAARSVLVDDERWLRMRLSLEDSAEVRATVMVNLLASGAVVGSDARDALDALLAHGAVGARIALAEAIARRSARGFERVLSALAHDREESVRVAAARAIATVRSPELLAALIELTADESTVRAAGEALGACGEEGLAAVSAALASRDTPAAVRWQLPDVARRFDPQQAASTLVAQLTKEWDGMVRYRTIRSLERLVHSRPDLVLDRAALDAIIDSTLRRAYRYLDRQLALARGAAADARRATEGHQLLRRLLADKQAQVVGRLFRLLGLVYRGEDFGRIHRALRSERRDVRDSGVELTEATLRPPLRGAVLGLIDDVPGEERMAAAGEYYQPFGGSYDDLLAHMLDSESETVRLLTVFHIGELRLAQFQPRLEQLAEREHESGDIRRSLFILREATRAG